VSKQLLIYEQAVPVSKEQHANYCVKIGEDYGFAKEINSVPLTAVEFPKTAPEYPIVFAGKDDSVVPVAILGVKDNENLFVDDKGAWTATYIPAFIRRYPFVFSNNEGTDTFSLCIDEQFSGSNEEGRGEHLFDKDGERTQYLNGVLEFVKEYQIQFNRTKVFCSKLQELDLLEPMQAQFSLPSGKKMSLSGFMVISRDKLKALPGDKLAELAGTDELELAYTHLQSMRNFSTMIERLVETGDATDSEDSVAAGADA